ncbi:Uroporphyrinogen-III methyltransferase [Fimbriiglobus ruber]|uniref:uroporphyrinogen-III C-methyltransferase n=2 Tax=Fimbriiglobus ruber TaxID=1908690 RepID=A0A225EAJ9_9BACT|nr:Uroporphyrinogen-III methyltransferase [Fimbriiglobus ruber]
MVSLVGAGPGSPDLITVRGLDRVRAADVVVFDALIHPDLLAAARSDAEMVYAGKRGYCVGSTLQETINDLLVHRARQGLRVVRLKGGDPCVFGRGGEEAEYLAERGVSFEIVPGVTTAVGACAAASIPLTHRDVGQAVALVTGHFDPDSSDCTIDWVALAGMSTVVVYMGLRHLDRIAAKLIAAGLPADTPAAVVARATLPDQVVIDAPLEDLAARVEVAGVTAPAVIVVGESVRVRARLLSLSTSAAQGVLA